MPITNIAAIKYSNEQFRPIADRLAKCYYKSLELQNLWTATPGTNDDKFAILQPAIKNLSSLIINTYRFVWWADRIWQAESLVSLFPNDAAEIVYDNSDNTGPDPTRSTISGMSCRRLKNRMEEFGNWLSRGTVANQHWVLDSAATLPITYAFFDDYARVASDSTKVLTSALGRVVAVDRCGQLVGQFSTTQPTYLTHILTVSVNGAE